MKGAPLTMPANGTAVYYAASLIYQNADTFLRWNIQPVSGSVLFQIINFNYMNFKELRSGSKSEKMLSKACVLLAGHICNSDIRLSPQDVLDVLEDLSNDMNGGLNETVGQIIKKLGVGSKIEKVECQHEKQKYDYSTGGGKCRNCGKLVGF